MFKVYLCTIIVTLTIKVRIKNFGDNIGNTHSIIIGINYRFLLPMSQVSMVADELWVVTPGKSKAIIIRCIHLRTTK